MQENYLAKWLSGELSEDELREFKGSEEYASYQKLKDVSSRLTAPEFDADQALQRLKDEYIDNAPKVISLNPFKKFLRVAAVIAVLLAGSYFYINTLNEVDKILGEHHFFKNTTFDNADVIEELITNCRKLYSKR